MSLKLMVRVMETIEVTRPQQAVLLAMAENASDDGSRCFPSVELIAWKAGYRPRNVVNIIRSLRGSGVLQEVAPASATRPIEYHIHLDVAPAKLSFSDWQRVHGRHADRYENPDSGVQSRNSRGAISELGGSEIAPLDDEQGCNLGTLGVQSHDLGVQSHDFSSSEIAPEPLVEPLQEPLGNREGGKAAPQPPPPPRPAPAPRAHRLPDDWTPTEALIQAVMVKHRMDRATIDFETEKFREHFGGNGKPMVRWELAWQKWMRSIPDFDRTQPRAPVGPRRDIGMTNDQLMAIARGDA